MSSSRLVTKKRRSDEKEDDLWRQRRSTTYRNGSICRSRIEQFDPIRKTRKKVTSSKKSERDDMHNELFKQLSAQKGQLCADKSMWLSAGSSSPLSCYDHRRSYALSNLNMSRNQRLVFVLMFLANLSSNMNKAKMLVDGSIVRPLEETPFVRLRNSLTQTKGDIKEDETVTWLGNSKRNAISFPESFSGLLSEKYSTFSNPSSVIGSIPDPEILSIDKIGNSESLVDLEEESSKWNSDIELDVDFLQADFPSPTCKNNKASDFQTSFSSSAQDTEASNGGKGYFSSTTDVSGSDAVNLEDSDDDQLLFWPSNLKFSWGSDAAQDFLVMSPPKKKIKAEATENTLKILHEKKVSNADLSKVDEVNLGDVNSDEPLVWPSGQKFDWNSDGAGNFFAMSPSKKRSKKMVTSQNTLASLKVDKSSMDASGFDAVNLEDFKTDEPLVWPSDQKFDWSSEAVWNIFNMSPPKKKKCKVVTSQKNLSSIKVDKNCILSGSQEAEAVNLEDVNADEPLLWPSDQKFDWNSEAAFNFFIMSPLKKKHGAAKFRNTSSPTVKNDEDLVMHFSGDDQPLFWPYDQAFNMDSDAARNYFIISPRKKIFKVGTAPRNRYYEQNDLEVCSMNQEVKAGRKRNRVISPGIESSNIVELRYVSDSKAVSKTKSVPTKLNEYHR